MAEKPVLQSSLGLVQSNSNRIDRSWTDGYLAIGKVTKVYHKRYTADVQITGTACGTLASAAANEGKYACKIMVNNAGYDTTLRKAYGEIIPIEVGTIVLVAFVKNNSNQPVIIGTFHNTDEEAGENNYMNVLQASVFSNADSTDLDKYRYANISRTQDFFTIDGFGDFEVSSHMRAFIAGGNQKTINEDDFEYDDLSIKGTSQDTIGLSEDLSKPMQLIAVFKSGVAEACDSVRLFVDATKNILKLMQVQRKLGQSSILEFTKEGDISLRRNLDTYLTLKSETKKYTEFSVTHDGKVVIRHQTSKDKYSEITTDADGKVTLNYGAGSKKSVIKMNDSGVEMTTESDIKITSTQKSTIDSKEDIEITSQAGMKSETESAQYNTSGATAFNTGSFAINSDGWPTINGKKIIVEGDETSDGATVSSNN